MREIKFRVWDKKEKIMRDVSELDFKEGYILCPKYVYVIPFEQAELMQFTGLKDKKGKEIYQGDIVKYKDQSNTSQIGEVRWGILNNIVD